MCDKIAPKRLQEPPKSEKHRESPNGLNLSRRLLGALEAVLEALGGLLEASEGILKALAGVLEAEVRQDSAKMAPRTPQERKTSRITERIEAPWKPLGSF